MASEKKSDPVEIMIVNDIPGEECRIAILEDNHLEELYSERTSSATKVGNIYKGRVVNVEPAIQAAFVDYGEGTNGFLHISDLHPRYFPGGDKKEQVGRKIPRRDRPPIQEALRRGDEVLVQVLKEGLGTKGPTLTSYLSIPGRLMVMMPEMDRVGVSRKVEDDDLRREMRKTLDSIDLPDGFGFILRTAGLGRTKTDLKRDVAYLTRLWKVMEKRIQNVGAPCELYTESDLLIRTVRDVLRPSIQAILVDSASAHERVSTFLQVVAPRSAPKVLRYRRSTPIFHAYDIERQIDLIHSRSVPLPSGGALVIDQTEALVAIDVNSGKSRSARDSETNAYRTNCEAVDEICRQLRLRDLGGLIVHDLIDMRMHKHRRLIEERFEKNLKRDRARSTVLKISEFGLVEMTRQRMRPSMRSSHFMTCPHCHGHGEIKSPDSVAADVARHINYLLDLERVRRVEIVCSPRVASVLLSRKRRELVRLEDLTGKTVDVRVSDDIAVDRVDYYAYDGRNADIDIEHLPTPTIPSVETLIREDLVPELQEGEEEDADEAGPRKRRRRRRRAGPADASAIALAGGFYDESEADGETVEAVEPETDEEEEAAPKKKRRRRRRGGGGKGGDDTAVAATVEAEEEPAAEDAESESRPKRRRRRRRRGGKGGEAVEAVEVAAVVEPAPVPEPMRVFQLAKVLGLPSKDIVARCLTEGIDTVKNHMSGLSGEQVAVVRSWFDEALEAAASTNEAAAEAAADESREESKDDEGESSGPRRKRRRRRGRRGRGGDGESSEAASAPEETTPPAAKRRRRRSESNDDGASTRKDTVDPAPESTPAKSGDGGAEAAPAPKKPRPLYRNRRKISPAAREAAEASA